MNTQSVEDLVKELLFFFALGASMEDIKALEGLKK